MNPYTEGRLDCDRIGIPRELFEIRTQPWLTEGSLTCDPCRTENPSFNCAPTQIHQHHSCFHVMNA